MRQVSLSSCAIPQRSAFSTTAIGVLIVTTAATAQVRQPPVMPWIDGQSLLDFYLPSHDHDDGGLAGGATGPQGAGDHVISMQCINGGWNWPHGGCAATYHNISPPIGEGLLQGYLATGDVDFLNAAIATANYNLTGVFTGSGDTRFGSFGPAFFHRLSTMTGNPTWSTNAATDFFDKLTAGTYGDPEVGGTYAFPGDTTDWINRLKELRAGGQVNLRPWDFHQMAWVAGQIGNPGQQNEFRDAILDSLNNLDDVQPFINPAYFGEIIGLAGGVRGLALNGTTTFPALVAPNYLTINGMTTLCQLADHLASLQEINGSWYWTENGAGATDEDVQTTAYAVLALVAAESAGCGPYTAQIALGRAYIASMQDGSGGYASYPTGPHNIEVDAEALWARAVSTSVTLSAPSCSDTSTVTIEINKSATTEVVVGGQFFLQYNTTYLSSPVVAAGDPPYTSIVASSTIPAGQVFVATGVSPGPGPVGVGTTSPAVMARITFTVSGDACDIADLVEWRTNLPPTRLTDDNGNEILPALTDLPAITLDNTDPIITCPPNIVTNADAGSCSALVDIYSSTVQTFDTNPVLNPTQLAGTWYTDRYAPFGFTSASFGGDNRLKHSINASDCEGCRPGGFNSAFYNTQGRKYDTPNGVGMTIDLYVPSAWATTGRRMAGFWGTGFDSLNNVSSFPIVEFTSGPDGSGLPRFRGWNNGVWIDMGLPGGFAYDAWYTLEIRLVGSNWRYSVGNLTLDVPATGSVQIANVILQGHNNLLGVTYDIYWDNFTSWTAPSATDNCGGPSIVGVRSDFPATLSDPYPSGVTTITWTATDCAGNTDSCVQTVTVNAQNTMMLDIAYDGGFAGTNFTRCIRFELFTCPSAIPVIVDQNVNFVNGQALNVAVNVPCGLYSCVTARDRKHTLRKTDGGFGIVGVVYDANFTSGDALVGGNLNDDPYIDILDFGIFIGQYNATPSPSTPCGYVGNHADISGNGAVTIGDYSFITSNFLQSHEANCCGAPRMAGGGGGGEGGPVTRISVKELMRRGMRDVIAGDLNQDGWVDTADVQYFMSGGSTGGSR